MDKINEMKLGLILEMGDDTGTLGTVIKLKDEKFDGSHPNNINEGYSKKGYFKERPTVGQRFNIGNFSSSQVIELLEDGKFRTLNSIYQLVEESK